MNKTQLERILYKSSYAIISADKKEYNQTELELARRRLENLLLESGYYFVKCLGKYNDVVEQGFFIFDISEKESQYIGKLYNQESVIWGHTLQFLNNKNDDYSYLHIKDILWDIKAIKQENYCIVDNIAFSFIF